ncbi:MULTISPECIES: HD-GYP domain-containing protein [Aneurinibacillus]|jgi:HD-GYP domain-containing protein (c-di-GMP phosphodiesterase class II)|uniref:HDIG domain-containing protein n=1 Tax=Aneurinibacillus danicus TaxID=267746 RepID=A0A511V752_9BACL|nr:MULTISPECIES: HD domain-containing phosphohydrolase [Aneurinibacillus]GEN34767.1 HDIG domain-containing protein [Aneurinibacillus danicus]
MDRVPVRELRPGMVVKEDVVCPRTKTTLVKAGVTLNEAIIMSLVKRSILSIAISDRYTLMLNPIDSLRKKLLQMAEERMALYAPNDRGANLSDEVYDVSRRILPIMHQIFANEDLLSLLMELRVLDNDDFYNHIVNTGVLSLLIGGLMNFSDEDLYCLGMGAFLHDVGLREMPFLIGGGGQELSNYQKAQFAEHSRYGYYILKEMGMPEAVADIVLNHHERWDGSGYPHGKKGKDIPLGSRILAVVEEYDTMVNMEGKLPKEALERLMEGKNVYFDGKIVDVFWNNIAVYPLGSLVSLSTGETGVVINVRKNSGIKPIVKVYFNRVNRPMKQPKVIDLAENSDIFIKKIL